jgi:alpha-glucosidase
MRSWATTRADPPRGRAASWWREGVIYQVYPRSFQDSDGDGVGDLAGIRRRLGYLARLGVDAIWLNPFYPSPMLDFGYDVCDHTDVDPLFGTLADFDALLADAHTCGLRVLIDFVPNHTSSEHPWFREARSSRASAKRDWYFWRDPRPDGSPPNNWASPFGGSQWTHDERSGQYYLHTFHPEQPDLNWRNPEVERAMLDVLRFWLERGVDGFRIDVANFVLKDPQLRDNPPNPTAGTSSYKYLGHYDTQLHLHDKGHPDCHPLYRRIRRLLDSYSRDGSDRIALGEIHLYEWPNWTRHWAAYYGERLDELHLPLNFTLVGRPWAADAFRAAVDEIEAVLPAGAWPNHVLGSHDEPRIASRIGSEQAKVATVLLLTLRGTPILYYGDELGMENVPVPIECARDPFGLLDPALGRDPERTPMQWDDGPTAGFCAAGVDPWLPLADNAAHVNVARQRKDPDSPLALTRRLLRLRRTTPALRLGDYQPLEAPDGCFAYLRTLGHDRVLAALNYTSETLELSLPAAGSLLVSTRPACDRRIRKQTIRLHPHEGCLLTLTSDRR